MEKALLRKTINIITGIPNSAVIAFTGRRNDFDNISHTMSIKAPVSILAGTKILWSEFENKFLVT